MKNRILGAVGIVLGGGMVVRWLMVGTESAGSGAFATGYQAGQNISVLLGVVMFAAGLFYFFKKPE